MEKALAMHAGLPSPACSLNQNRRALGIPNDSISPENAGNDVSDIAERQHEERDRETALPRRFEMLNVLGRYETHIMNQITKILRLLFSLQASHHK